AKTTISSRPIEGGNKKIYTHRLQDSLLDIAAALQEIDTSTVSNHRSNNNNLPSPHIHLDPISETTHILKENLLTNHLDITTLTEITKKIINLDNLNIYTDGSLKQLNNTCKMGIGWVIFDQDDNQITSYKATTNNTPSSTKA